MTGGNRRAGADEIREAGVLIEPFIEHLGEPRVFWLRKPREIGRRILIARKGSSVPHPPGDRIVISLDPKSAFGTGGHGTTEGCLMALEKVIKGGESVLDVGTGTGILAIAAWKLGAGRVTAIDIDRAACRAAGENLALNGIGKGVDLIEGGPKSVGGAFDVIVANLRTGVLVGLMDDLVRRMEEHGVAILSGIMEKELHPFLRFLGSRRLDPSETIGSRGWVTVVLTRAANLPAVPGNLTR
jgi:ribosomal protein L11 methyltransferase